MSREHPPPPGPDEAADDFALVSAVVRDMLVEQAGGQPPAAEHDRLLRDPLAAIDAALESPGPHDPGAPGPATHLDPEDRAILAAARDGFEAARELVGGLLDEAAPGLDPAAASAQGTVDPSATSDRQRHIARILAILADLARQMPEGDGVGHGMVPGTTPDPGVGTGHPGSGDPATVGELLGRLAERLAPPGDGT